MFPLSYLLKRRIRQGTLKVIDAKGAVHVFGAGAPTVTMRITDKALYRKLFFSPDPSLGEAYVDGTVVFEDGSGLRDFMGLFGTNREQLPRQPAQGHRVGRGR